MTTFRDLAIGTEFEFDHTELDAKLGYPCGLATGPWIKTSARTYKPVDDRWNGERTRIGSVNVPVRPPTREEA